MADKLLTPLEKMLEAQAAWEALCRRIHERDRTGLAALQPAKKLEDNDQ